MAIFRNLGVNLRDRLCDVPTAGNDLLSKKWAGKFSPAHFYLEHSLKSILLLGFAIEEHSHRVADLVKSSNVTATSLVAYAEARAAFARRFREKAFTPTEHGRLVSSLNEDWGYYLIMRVTKELVHLAGDLAERHGLMGLGAIHLSSALTLRQELSAPVIFSCSDRKLQKASQLEDLDQPE